METSMFGMRLMLSFGLNIKQCRDNPILVDEGGEYYFVMFDGLMINLPFIEIIIGTTSDPSPDMSGPEEDLLL